MVIKLKTSLQYYIRNIFQLKNKFEKKNIKKCLYACEHGGILNAVSVKGKGKDKDKDKGKIKLNL